MKIWKLGYDDQEFEETERGWIQDVFIFMLYGADAHQASGGSLKTGYQG